MQLLLQSRSEKVKFVGDIVAAVVATNRYVAEDGVELVEVELRTVARPSSMPRKGDAEWLAYYP